MTTPRRNVLAAIFAAPVAALSGAATAAPLARDMEELEMADLLRLGAAVRGDATFATLCANAIPLALEAERAWALYRDASETADTMSPFPATLLQPRVYRHANGEPEHYNEEWSPANDRGGWQLRSLALSHLRASLGREPSLGEMTTHEAALRAQWNAWSEVKTQAHAACLVGDLCAAADAAEAAFQERYSAIMAHRPRSASALHVKCWLRWADPQPNGFALCRDIAADVQTALG